MSPSIERVLERKREGGPLSTEEIAWLVRGIVDGSVTRAQAAAAGSTRSSEPRHAPGTEGPGHPAGSFFISDEPGSAGALIPVASGLAPTQCRGMERAPFRTLIPAIATVLAGCGDGDPFARPEQPVPTPAGLIDASDPQPISEIAWRYGESSWSRDGLGDPRIGSLMGGVPYVIEFYGCREGRDCTDLRFVTRMTVPDADDPGKPASRQALAWATARLNAGRRFGKASLGEEAGEVVIEMNATLAGGVTRQNLDMIFDWWRVVVAESRDLATG